MFIKDQFKIHHNIKIHTNGDISIQHVNIFFFFSKHISNAATDIKFILDIDTSAIKLH